MDTPKALILLTIRPNTWADEENLRRGLRQMTADDPTISVGTDEESRATVIGAISEVQLEIIVDRLTREFHVAASVDRPTVAYKEALTRAADGEMKYARQMGGRGQYGHVKIHLFPGEPGSGYIFGNNVTQGSIPREFIKSINAGVAEALGRGILAGCPIDDVRVVLYDGSYHDADSSDDAFRIAGAMAFQEAATKAQPVLLEPIMRIEVSTPEEGLDDIEDELERRRGRIQSQERRGGMQVVHARVPLATMFGYASDLRSRTQGRATYSMQLDGYEPVDDTLDSGDGDSFVGAPRRPVRPLNRLSVELPEPNDDAGY